MRGLRQDRYADRNTSHTQTQRLARQDFLGGSHDSKAKENARLVQRMS